MSTTTHPGYSDEDLSSPYFMDRNGYRSVPGYPHIWILADGSEVWNAKRNRALKIRLNNYGYPMVTFGSRDWRVQRLVLASWHPGCLDDGSMALHRIPQRDYVALWNLKPGDYTQNRRDRMIDSGNVDADHCNRGHALIAENLRASTAKQGKRSCLSCDRARSRVTNGKRLKGTDQSTNLDAYADEYFMAIVSEYVAKTVAAARFAIANPIAATRMAATNE